MVPAVRARRRCAFCGEPGSSKEDVFAKWLTNALGGSGPHGFNLSRSKGRSKTNIGFLGVTTRAACRKCNNEWMSQFEQSVQLYLEPIVRNEPTQLRSKNEQTILARWVYKTALMYDRSNKPTEWAVAEEHFRYLFQHRQPPPSVTILAGRYVPQPGEEPFAAWAGASWFNAHAASGEEFKGYRVTFSIGHAIFQVFGHVTPDNARLVPQQVLVIDGREFPNALQQLWPLTGKPHDWPPPDVVFNTAGLKLLEYEG